MWRYLIIVVVLTALGGLGWAYYNEINQILRQEPTAWNKDHQADCGIVVTGGPSRVRAGFDLLAHGEIKKLIISGVHPQARLREIFPEWPYYGDLKEKDVILERRSGTTYGNAQQSLPLVEALHCRDLVLVTSRVHMQRASRTFEAVFPDEYPIYERAMVAGSYRPSWSRLFIEATKSLFYDLWAY